VQRSYDAIVVGAGIVGLSCAWRLARTGRSVLVVDRGAPGSGASGVAAGMLAPVTEADFGEAALLELNLAGARAWPAFAEELAERSSLDPGRRASGALVVAADHDDGLELRRLGEFQRSLGLESRWLTRREARELEPGLSPRTAGAILAPGDHHVDPAATVAALATAFEHEGGELAVAAEVALETAGGRVTGVRASGTPIAAEHVIVAAGAHSGVIAGLPESARVRVRPVKGQILGLRGPGGSHPLAARLVRTLRCYVVDRGDGRVVVGATTEDRGFDERVTAEGVFRLLEAAREVLPDVDELEVVTARAGLRPGSPDNLPFVGRGALEGLVWATGHGRNGVLLAPLTGTAISALLDEEPLPAELGPCRPGRFGALDGQSLALRSATPVPAP
jgi:glycine oxidase